LGGEIGGILEAPTRLLDAYYLYTAGLLIIYNTYNYQYERSVVCAWHGTTKYCMETGHTSVEYISIKK